MIVGADVIVNVAGEWLPASVQAVDKDFREVRQPMYEASDEMCCSRYTRPLQLARVPARPPRHCSFAYHRLLTTAHLQVSIRIQDTQQVIVLNWHEADTPSRVCIPQPPHDPVLGGGNPVADSPLSTAVGLLHSMSPSQVTSDLSQRVAVLRTLQKQVCGRAMNQLGTASLQTCSYAEPLLFHTQTGSGARAEGTRAYAAAYRSTLDMGYGDQLDDLAETMLQSQRGHYALGQPVLGPTDAQPRS